MLRLNASPDAARLSRRSTPLGVALSGVLAASTASAQPAPPRQPGGTAMPAQPGAMPAQPGVMPAQPGAMPAQPGAMPAQPGAMPAQPFPQAPPGVAPPQNGAAPTAPGYPPQGYYGNYPQPYGGYYPPPGYYFPSPQDPPPAPKPVAMRRKDEGLMYGGMALTGGGIVGFFIGTILLATANGRYEIYCDLGGSTSLCEERDDEPRQVAGAVVTVAGGVLLGVGIPLWVIGGKKVPIDGEAPKPALQPTLSLGPGSAALHMAF